MTKISTKKYDFLFQPNLVEIKLNPSLKGIIITFIIVFIISIPFAILSIKLISIEVNMHSIIFISTTSCVYVCDFVGTIIEIIRIKKFKIVLDAQGVHNTEINSKNFIPWKEIMSYGFVNDNIINGAFARRDSPKQLCLYFSKNLYTEKKLRKKFDRIENRFFLHINSNEMIVITIENESIQESIVFNLKKIIRKYCDCKEKSYIKQTDDV